MHLQAWVSQHLNHLYMLAFKGLYNICNKFPCVLGDTFIKHIFHPKASRALCFSKGNYQNNNARDNMQSSVTPCAPLFTHGWQV